MNYKSGDLVTITGNSNGHAFTIGETVRLMKKRLNVPVWQAEYLDKHDWWNVYERDMKPATLTYLPQKIVITTDGKTTLARLYDGKTMVKRAEAKCAPSDTFDFSAGADLAFKRLMGTPVIGAGKEESKPEPIKLYCVESCNGMITRGKIYEFNGRGITYDDGYCNNYSQTFEQWKSGNQTYASRLVPLVHRSAKVGEWVYIYDAFFPMPDNKNPEYQNGDVLQIIGIEQNGHWFRFKKGRNSHGTEYVLVRREYLVLDGYKGECP